MRVVGLRSGLTVRKEVIFVYRSWEGHPPAMDKDNAKRILLEVKEVLDRNNVEFWLCFATCLGAIREGDFIDIDFDIDLGIKHDILVPKLYDLDKQFKELGYDTKFLSTPYDYDRMIKLDKDNIRVDLMNWDLVINNFSNTVRAYYFHPVEPDGKCHVFIREMFDNLKKIKFCGKDFNVPLADEMYLKLLYGENWRVKDENYDFRKAKCLVMDYWNNTVKPLRGLV